MENQESAMMHNLPGMAYKIINNGNWTIEYVSEGCIKLFREELYRLATK